MTIKELKELINKLEKENKISDDSKVIQNYDGEELKPYILLDDDGCLVFCAGSYGDNEEVVWDEY